MYVLKNDPMQFEASRIIFGHFKAKPAAQVTLNASEIIFKVGDPIDANKTVTIVIDRAHIVKTIVTCGEKTIFLINVLAKCSEYIRTNLHINEIDATKDIVAGDTKWILVETCTKLDITKFPRVIAVNDEVSPVEMAALVKHRIYHKFRSDSIILTYPSCGVGAISITANDFKCLATDEYLNDVIINFFIKYLFEEVLTANQKLVTYMFDTFFYETLSGASRNSVRKQHNRVENWTKRVNIFEKDFIVVPINQSVHWFLAIICFPNVRSTEPAKRKSTRTTKTKNDKSRSDDIEKRPCILIFDSISSSDRPDVVKKLRNYLNSEYKTKCTDGNDYTFDTVNMPGHSVRAPCQQNVTDCGIYMLQYIEQFFKDPITDFELPIKNLENWFKTSVATQKRAEIVDIIKEQITKQNANGLSTIDRLPEINLPK